MGKEQTNSYYDAIYGKSNEYVKHYLTSRYYNLWKEVLKNLDMKQPVLDIGCGPGQLAEMLHESGLQRGEYIGVDFSQEAIDMAKRRLPEHNFVCQDIFKLDYSMFPGAQVLICETLEHIDKDIELLKLIQFDLAGRPFVFTVPTFDDPGHVRHFKSWEAALERYGKCVNTVHRCERFGAWIVIAGIL